jgi:CheY-like chemotaxis protein
MHPLVFPSWGLRILVADDYPDIGESLQILLHLWGHEVVVARNGLDALASAQAFRPHVALLDLEMPGLSGGEVARRLRQIPEFEGLVIVAATGHDHDEESLKPYCEHFDYHFRKPFNLGELENLLACYSRVVEPEGSSDGLGT